MAGNILSAEEIKVALGYGQCHFQQNLGEGSFGKVVRATHQVTERHYAIKMMVCDDKERKKYQRRELDLLTKQEISNPNIIRYFNSWVRTVENKQILCIQMELCFSSLSKLLQTNPWIVKDERRLYKHIFPQILNGLDAIHRIGWIHRDIHPGNILIANPKPSCIFQDTVIKIADFGLARHIDPLASMKLSDKSILDKLSLNVGNKFFRAPETSGNIYDYKVDLYSAGIVLYMLSCYLEVPESQPSTQLPSQPATDQCRKTVKQCQWEAMWEQEILALREGQRGENNLCHKDQLLTKLLDDLLKLNAVERPSACDALKRFNLSVPATEEVDGVKVEPFSPTSCTKFLVKKEGEESYNRCSCPAEDQSFAGLKEAIQACPSVGTPKENQLIQQEICEPNGEKLLVNVTSDANVEEMFQSAEKAGCRVKLIVLNKDKPGAEIPDSNTEAMEL